MMSVLLAVFLLAHFVTGLSASLSSITKRDDYSDIVWQGSGPMMGTDYNAFDARAPGVKDSDWFWYKDGGIGVGLDGPGGQVAWRLRTDHANEVVFKLNSNLLLAASYSGDSDNAPSGIQNFATVGEADFQNSTSDATSGDIWTSTTGFKLVDWSISASIDNGCTDTKTFVITTVDANGTTNTTSAVDYIPSLAIPSALPANLTITTQENPSDIITITYYNSQALTYKLGSGSVEPSIPPATIYTSVFWCDTD